MRANFLTAAAARRCRARMGAYSGRCEARAEAWPALAALSAAEVAGFFAASLPGPRP